MLLIVKFVAGDLAAEVVNILGFFSVDVLDGFAHVFLFKSSGGAVVIHVQRLADHLELILCEID